MNKTIIININGFVFHIEEDAYEILRIYMTNVKRHFLNSDDSLEITTDIENRIAEMFTEILARENKQVIVEQDVDQVIEQMGTVEDFESADTDQKAPPNNAYTYNTNERKLFRDPDDHLVSGVCAGIANYFDIEPVWVRLAFALSFLFAGTGLFLYIILWIVIPKALTRSERMAMKGEKLNLQGFKNNLEEELSSVRNHLNNLHEEARPLVYKLRDFIGDVVNHLGLFFSGAGKLLVKLIGVIMLLACFGAAVALIVVFVLIVGFGRPIDILPFSIIPNEHASRIYVTAFLIAFIPVLSLILLLIGAVFNTKSIGRSVGTTILVVWLCAIGFLGFYASKALRNFRSSASFTQTIKLKPTSDNTYYLKLNDIKYLTHDDSLNLDVKNRFNSITLTNDDDEDTNEPRNVSIHVERSDVSEPELIELFKAKGRNYGNALLNARNTRYIFIQQDSVIKFDYKLRRPTYEPWHDEKVELTLKMPLNAKLVIDQELDNHVGIDGIDVNDCKNNDKHANATSAAFIMTADGLQCKIDTLIIPPGSKPVTLKAGDKSNKNSKPDSLHHK